MRLLRLRRRIDAVLATDRAVLVVQVRPDARAFTEADRREAEDAALDLADFHAGCRGVPVIPVVLGAEWGAGADPASAGAGRGGAGRGGDAAVLAGAAAGSRAGLPAARAAGRDWLAAPYAPVPALLDAACMLYARHDVAALTLARAGPAGLARTASAVADGGAAGARRRARGWWCS